MLKPELGTKLAGISGAKLELVDRPPILTERNVGFIVGHSVVF